jgi:hypothetical protein
MQDAGILLLTNYTLVKCVTCRVETHEMFVSSKVMMVMLTGEKESPHYVAALSGALTSHVLALHAAEIYKYI